MEWPNEVPFFTENDVHNIPDGEYEIEEDGQIKRCAMGWLKHLFLDLEEWGALDRTKLMKAEVTFRHLAGIGRYESLEEWNDKQNRPRIAHLLNQTMVKLGYDQHV